MFSTGWFRLASVGIGLAALAAPAPEAGAQGGNFNVPPVGSSAPRESPREVPSSGRELELNEDVIRAIHDEENTPRRAVKPILDVELVPWTNQAGDRLVGVVENRELTANEMRRRAQIMIGMAPKLEPPASAQRDYANDPEALLEVQKELIEARRLAYESTVVKDWVRVTALAVYAERTGITVSDPEIDRALAELANMSGTQGAEQQRGMMAIGVAEQDLRREVRDSLLVEKVLDRTVNEYFSEAQKRQLFQQTPGAYLPAPAVRAWQLFLPQFQRLTSGEQSKIEKEMKAIGKLLRKAPDDPAMIEQLQEQIRAEYPREPQYALADLGWIEGGSSSIPIPTINLLFETDAGDVSAPMQFNFNSVQRGYFLVKVLEHRAGGNSYEEALPQINNALHNEVRNALFDKVRAEMDIFQAASGLNRRIKKDPAEVARQQERDAVRPSDAPRVTIPEPDLGPLLNNPPPVEATPARPIRTPRPNDATGTKIIAPSEQRIGERKPFSEPPPVE